MSPPSPTHPTGEPKDKISPLARRVWRRYGESPGVTSTTFTPASQRARRRSVGLPLLTDVLRRWTWNDSGIGGRSGFVYGSRAFTRGEAASTFNPLRTGERLPDPTGSSSPSWGSGTNATIMPPNIQAAPITPRIGSQGTNQLLGSVSAQSTPLGADRTQLSNNTKPIMSSPDPSPISSQSDAPLFGQTRFSQGLTAPLTIRSRPYERIVSVQRTFAGETSPHPVPLLTLASHSEQPGSGASHLSDQIRYEQADSSAPASGPEPRESLSLESHGTKIFRRYAIPPLDDRSPRESLGAALKPFRLVKDYAQMATAPAGGLSGGSGASNFRDATAAVPSFQLKRTEDVSTRTSGAIDSVRIARALSQAPQSNTATAMPLSFARTDLFSGASSFAAQAAIPEQRSRYAAPSLVYSTVQRAVASNGSDSSSTPAAASTSPDAELPTMTASRTEPQVDLRQITDQVYQMLVSRLTSERERRGI